ncbi:isoprenoid biosynthesis glyoxalase ElbB [Plebeiibacterium marinum]|uniref:Isoprenoid biosynthesis glyoxalase ElbB n=1 Tax=Plebeiibacterium marinum TaxID=2992111 RepID=A0AAE3SL37_9BACT|nr:isoprenoid biosynthesis glyoxalase ElbB [Plebeiobacterium marinum]MCW3807292.1 isoprenoid biosynthesis glyoxalase ElbB [Plebeiobacterium marinum]
MKNIAVVLSGCGVFDGSEIHEATLTLLAINKKGAIYQCFAPNTTQHHVINHITGEEMQESRNVLVESARIARGQIKDLETLNSNDFDAIVFPGGFGAAKNLSNLAFEGADCKVLPLVAEKIKEFWTNKKPIGAMCIAPAVIAKIIPGSLVTIGNDIATKDTITQMGSTHQNTNHTETVIDAKNKIVTTPCYMLDANIAQIEQGTLNLIDEIIKL